MSNLKVKTINEAGSPMCVSSVLSTLYGITVSNNLNVNGTSYISGNSTFDTVLAKSICSCAATPTLASHLANKGYVDGRNIQKGQLVYFYAFGGCGSELAVITLPPGTYKMKVDAIYAVFVNGGAGAANYTSTVTGTWGSVVSASNTTNHRIGNTKGCGGYLWDITKNIAVSSSFELLTTTSNTLSITATTFVGYIPDPYSCTVSFYAA
jgi:hypothetical protein